jgi:hypothetical protein
LDYCFTNEQKGKEDDIFVLLKLKTGIIFPCCTTLEEAYQCILLNILLLLKDYVPKHILIIYPWDVSFCIYRYMPYVKQCLNEEDERFLQVALQTENKAFHHTLSMEFMAGFLLTCETINQCHFIPSFYECYLSWGYTSFNLQDRFLLKDGFFHDAKYTIQIKGGNMYGFNTLEFLDGIKTCGEWSGYILNALFEPILEWTYNPETQIQQKIKQFRFL